jgi:bacillithiol disulfide reductase
MHTYDIAIIGAGPIGIELASALKAEGMDYVHFEAGQIGSTMQWWAPGTKYFSSPERIEIAGVPLVVADQEKANRENYLDYLRTVVGVHKLDIETFTRVTKITRDDDAGFTIETIRSHHGVGGPDEQSFDHEQLHIQSRQTTTWRAKRIVLAMGDMHRPRTLNIPGEDQPHVSHFLGDAHQYANQNVLIVGGKNSAVEAAIRLFRVGANVTMSYRGKFFDPDRIKYWLYPEIEYLIKKDKIRYLPFSNLDSIDERSTMIRSNEGTQRLDTDFVLLMTGYTQDPSLFEQLGITLIGDDRKPTFSLKTMETDVPGVFVAGTASAGTQSRTKVFIETSHVHVDRIIAALQGRVSDSIAEDYTLEES